MALDLAMDLFLNLGTPERQCVQGTQMSRHAKALSRTERPECDMNSSEY